MEKTKTTTKRGGAFYVLGLAGLAGIAQIILKILEPSQRISVRPFPSSSEVLANVKLFLIGHRTGFNEIFSGYHDFGFQLLFFLSVGRLVFNRILPLEERETLNPFEKLAYSNLLGTLVAALLWFVLGLLGLLTPTVANVIAVLGGACFIQQVFPLRNYFRNRGGEISQGWKSLTNLEKILTVFVFSVIALQSLHCVRLQDYSDALQIHLALPAFHIGNGKLLPNVYEIYSYFPQNLEMLLTWSLLLDGEHSCVLIVWGFFASFAFLLFGFLKRKTGVLPALLASLIFIAAPSVSWFATAVKNDLPVGAFVFAHYAALYMALEKREENLLGAAKQWIFLSGLLCGGAAGFKPTALYALLLTFGVLLYVDFTEKKESKSFLSLWFLAAAMIAAGGWFLRSLILTGDPLYPFLTNLFHRPLLQEWHVAAPHTGLLNGGKAVKDYFLLLAGFLRSDGKLLMPNWGPGVVFILTVPFCLTRKWPKPLILSLLSAFAAWIFLSIYSLETRYHLGMIGWLACVPLAFVTEEIFRSSNRKLKAAAVGIVLFCGGATFLFAKTLTAYRDLFLETTGYLSGNFLPGEIVGNDLRWMTHFLNSRTPKTDGVLFAMTDYQFGFRRRALYSNDLCRDALLDLAMHSANADELKQKLKALKIDHVLMNTNYFSLLTNQERPELKGNAADLEKIKELMEKEMVLRLVTPDQREAWYTFKDSQGQEPVQINQSDIEEQPMTMFDYVVALTRMRAITQAEKLCEIAVKSNLYSVNKAQFMGHLGMLQLFQQKKEGKETILHAAELYPDNFIVHLYAALYYASVRDTGKKEDELKRAVDLVGEENVRRHPLYPLILSIHT